MDLKRHINVGLGYFILAALFGVVLRLMHAVRIPVEYRFFVHTHSHIALLGWVYVAMTTLLYWIYLKELDLDRRYRRIFWGTQVTLLGMLFSFPFQGYALFSIVFSTLFLFASYWFAYFFFKNVPSSKKTAPAYQCFKWALWYMVISSLGPWSLGGIMNTLGAESIWYRLSVYFYLHFQYNGWMVLFLLGGFIGIMGKMGLPLPKKKFNAFLLYINLGVVLSFFLSTLWTQPSVLFNFLGAGGALLQILAFGWLLWFIHGNSKGIETGIKAYQKRIIKLVVLVYGVKILLQLVSAWPYVANLAATIIDFTIGYLHWTFLGVVTIGLFALLDHHRLLHLSRYGFIVYILGFLGTEFLIFYKGIMAWQKMPVFEHYAEVLSLVSTILLLALLVIFVVNLVATRRSKAFDTER